MDNCSLCALLCFGCDVVFAVHLRLSFVRRLAHRVPLMSARAAVDSDLAN
jgi:hypothetical protein